MISKRISLAIMLLLTLLFVSGCWDREELEDHAYVVAIGVDTVPGDNQAKLFTVQIAVPSKLSGGGGGGSGDGGGGDKAFFQVSTKAESLASALSNMQSELSRHVSLLQCRAVFMSESIARKSILSGLEAIVRNPEMRRSVFIGIIEGNAEKFLEANVPKLHNNISRYYEEISSLERFTGYTSASSFQRVAEGVETLGEDAVAALGKITTTEADGTQNQNSASATDKGKDKAEFIGVAVFHKDKMVGTLGKRDTQLLNMLRDDWVRADFEIRDPLNPSKILGLSLREDKAPKVTVDLAADPIRIDAEIHLVGSLLAQYTMEDLTTQENRNKLEAALKRELETQAQHVVGLAQQEFRADIFRFGNVGAKKNFVTWQEWSDYNWPEKFPYADIHVTADVSVNWFGMQNKPLVPAPK